MKIKTIRLENFRSFIDQEVNLNRYSCFVGPNGAGKSTILCALNVFFKEQDTATDTHKLCDEDYFARNTDIPIRITLTFDDLNEAAKRELSDYVRQNELVVTAEATFDDDTGVGIVHHYGQRLGMEQFRPYFEAAKRSAKADELNQIYATLQQEFTDLPNARSKDAKAEALQEYEANNQALCTLIQSEDNFYGINSTGKLAEFVQWVYVPAVKDAGQEGQEAKNTAFGNAQLTSNGFPADFTQAVWEQRLHVNTTSFDPSRVNPVFSANGARCWSMHGLKRIGGSQKSGTTPGRKNCNCICWDSATANSC